MTEPARTTSQHLTPEERRTIVFRLQHKGKSDAICREYNISKRTLNRIAKAASLPMGQHGGRREPSNYVGKPVIEHRHGEFTPPNAIPSVLHKIRGGRA